MTRKLDEKDLDGVAGGNLVGIDENNDGARDRQDVPPPDSSGPQASPDADADQGDQAGPVDLQQV